MSATAKTNNRKTTAAYYTPSRLIECLLDEALEPVLDDLVKDKQAATEKEAALLSATVCDPSCGAGAFLIGAQRRIASRLIEVRHGTQEVSLWHHLNALRDASRCLYAVDLNPLAVELAKLVVAVDCFHFSVPNLFLDARFRVGNALLGTTPALLAKGIPDAAFTPITGDDPKVAAMWRKRNKQEREAMQSSHLFDTSEPARERAGAGEDITPRLFKENYWAPFGTPLLDPAALRKAVAHEVQTANPQNLMWQTAKKRWQVGWSNALLKQHSECSKISNKGEPATDQLELLKKLIAEYDRVNKDIDADPLRLFDSMMFVEGPQSEKTRAHLAYVIACLARAPGGIGFAGLHWCVGGGHVHGIESDTPCAEELDREACREGEA